MERCHVQADVDVPGAWRVVTILDDETVMEVPGVTAVKPTPRWVLAPDSKLKRERAEAAAGFVEEQLADPVDAVVADVLAEIDVTTPSGLDEFHPDTTHNPATVAAEPVEVPSEPADEDDDNTGDTDEDDIVWDDEPAEGESTSGEGSRARPSDADPLPGTNLTVGEAIARVSAQPSAADVRAWAKTAGIKVPARGAVPADVRTAYDKAHS